MREEHPDWIRYRWLRPDGDRYLRHDAARYLKPAPFDHKALITEYRAAAQKDAVAAHLHTQRAREGRQRRLEILRIKSDIAALLFQRAMVLHMVALQREAKFNPNQPRVPAGSREGGQWTDDGSGTGGERINDSRVISDASDIPILGARYTQADTPGPGHNHPPPGPLPDVPKERPATPKEQHRIAQEVARRIAGGEGRAEQFYKLGEWLRDFHASISSYQDSPKSFEEMRDAATEDSKRGYNDHHVVLQAARNEGDGERTFPKSKIDERDNIVRIPTFKHWAIHSWYEQPNSQAPYNDLSPRAYLRGKSWEERYEIGLKVLRDHGVLKP